MRRTALGSVLLASALIAAGCSAERGVNFATMAAVDEGVTVTDNGLSVTSLDAAQQQDIGIYPGPWLIVRLHVSAGRDGPELFDPAFQELLIDGHAYDADAEPAEEIDDETASAASLLPGKEADVSLAFKVANDVAEKLPSLPVQLVVRGRLESRGIPITLKIH